MIIIYNSILIDVYFFILNFTSYGINVHDLCHNLEVAVQLDPKVVDLIQCS